MRRHTDVAVIGAGVVGCSVALELARKGFGVTVYDKSRTGPGSGTTSYSSGIIRCFYSVPEMIAFSWECYHYWRDWESHVEAVPTPSNPQPKLRKCGALLLRNVHSERFINSQIPTYDRLRMPYALLGFDETKAKTDRLKWDISRVYRPCNPRSAEFGTALPGESVSGSLWLPETGYISDPRLAAENLAAAAQRHGAVFEFDTEVMGILQRDGRVTGLRYREGPVFLQKETPIVVNCAGPYSNLITRMAFPPEAAGVDTPANDMNVTTRPLRAEVAFLAPPDGVDMEADGFMTADFDHGTYMRPEVGNKLLVGSIDPECDPMHWVQDLTTMDPNISEQWDECVYRAALRMPSIPIPSARSAQGIASSYDVTEDWQPILDKSALDGFYMAIGTSGNCFKCAPIIGKVMAQLIAGTEGSRAANGRPSFNHDDTPLQLPLLFTGHSLDTAAFSRRRKFHETLAGVIG